MKKSKLALGCMRMSALTNAEAERVILDAFEHEITLFDHADIYGGGKSEELFGSALNTHPWLREKIILQDKCGICKGYYDLSRAHILEAVDGSLKRLGTDHLDILLLHRPDALMEPAEIAEAFQLLRKDGKVFHFGVSNMNPAQIELIEQAAPGSITINQLQFGLGHTALIDEGICVNTTFDQGIVRTGSVLDYCQLKKIEIQAWSPLQYGFFEGTIFSNSKYQPLVQKLESIGAEQHVSAPAVAIAWIMRHPAHIVPVLGSMNIQHLDELYEAVNVQIERKTWYELYQLAGNPLP